MKNIQEIIISILKDCGAKVRPTGSSKVPTNSKTGGSRFDVESKQNEKPNYHLKNDKMNLGLSKECNTVVDKECKEVVETKCQVSYW